MPNDKLFENYDKELMLRSRNPRNLDSTRSLLAQFKQYLGEHPPSALLARGFLAKFTDKAPRTLLKYASIIKSFMRYCGEPIDDFPLPKVPRSLPNYYEDNEVERLLSAIENKKSHKGTIDRDSLLLSLALTSGLRRSELANLEPRNIHADFIEVKDGKGKRDRIVPLLPDIAVRLRNFIKGKQPTEKVFGLTGPSISNKIKRFAQKAGLNDFHAHSTRHKYAVDLLESGVDLRSVQLLLGHSDLGTTAIYLSITDKRLQDAMGKLKEHMDHKRRIRQPKSDKIVLYKKGGAVILRRPTSTG